MSESDGERTSFLRSRGIEVVRITNELLARDSFMAEQVIEAAITNRWREMRA